MRANPIVPVLALVLAAGLGCGGPLLVMPGGALAGEEAPAPSDWAFSDAVGTVQLETRPSDPYSVNIWVVGLGAHAYVHAGANRSAWVEHMEADPNVRLQVEDAIYPLRGERVSDAGEFARFADAYEAKYGRRPRNENVAEVYLFRLGPR